MLHAAVDTPGKVGETSRTALLNRTSPFQGIEG
jgi:hypothetical protein